MRYMLLLTPVILSCFHVEAIGQDRQKAMQPFRSELWQREFRAEDKKDAEKSLPAEEQKLPSAENTAKALKNLTEVEVSSGKFPGEMDADELRDSTPMAEWQIDKGASRTAGESAFRDEPSAWQLSHAGTMDDPDVEQMAEGPSATTYLVGLMACIVVVGALLTGRET